ncbi:MAG: GHMP kinase [Chloroflexota bacterium]|nr:MAG: GHMP kinase [Chloroflexota bacterium]
MSEQNTRATAGPSSKAATYRGAVRMPATCGELAQGALGGVHFHVSCPVDMYATIEVELDPRLEDITADAGHAKARAACEAALADIGGKHLGGKLTIRSPIPRAKGMGSSTADVAGAIYAVGQALGIVLPPRRVAELALEIEPTDGSIFPDVVVFDHRQGLILEALGPPPPLGILCLDFGGEVDTVEFNCTDRSAALRETEPATRRALEFIKDGFALQRPDLIGAGATLSAEANQCILFKPAFDSVGRFAEDIGALGVVAAHSGSILGILFDPGRCDGRQLKVLAHRTLPTLRVSYLHRITGGGARPLL